jgi:hypothetical protein
MHVPGGGVLPEHVQIAGEVVRQGQSVGMVVAEQPPAAVEGVLIEVSSGGVARTCADRRRGCQPRHRVGRCPGPELLSTVAAGPSESGWDGAAPGEDCGRSRPTRLALVLSAAAGVLYFA